MKKKKGQVTPLAFFVSAIIIVIFGVFTISYSADQAELGEFEDFSSSQTILTETTETISPIGDGITSLTATALNQTWLDFDGIDDVVTLTSDEITSISFWYKNETLDWTFITNSSGTLYVDGVAATPEQFPVIYNGSDYLIGKEGAVFFNGSIDDFRVYDSTLDAELVGLIYGDFKL